jgi:hypothetical protein
VILAPSPCLFTVAPGLTRGPAAFCDVASEAGPRVKPGVTRGGNAKDSFRNRNQMVAGISHALLFAAAFVWADNAFACTNLPPAEKRREVAQQARYLASADRVLDGQLVFDPSSSDDELVAVGTLQVLKGNDAGKSVRVFAPQLIGCGFPNYPLRWGPNPDGLSGRFFLKRKDGYFDVLHFEPLGGAK